jgi:hypothetical protein
MMGVGRNSTELCLDPAAWFHKPTGRAGHALTRIE